MRRTKKGLSLSRALVILLVVLFGSSAFAMQQLQWMTFNAGDSVVPPTYLSVQGNEPYDGIDAGILLVAKSVPQEIIAEPQEQDVKEDADVNPAQNDNVNVAQAPRQQSATPAPKVDKPQTKTTQADKPAARPEAAPQPEVKVAVQTTLANPYKVLSSGDYRMLTRLVVKNTSNETSNNVRIELPLVTTSSFYFTRRGESFSLEPEVTTVNGTRVGVFSLGNLQPGEETVVEVRTQTRTLNVHFLADYVPTKGNTITSHLGATKGIESTNAQIVSLSNQLTQNLSTDWDKARAITRWVATNITYDASAANRNSGALAALQSRRGVCEDYAALCAALGRAAQIPTRVVYGYTDSGSRWPATGAFSLSGFRHAWVEFYLEGRGWVPAEPTRSNSSNLYFGTLPHHRYIVQNYTNMSLKGNYSGGKLSISWAESLY